MRIMVAPLFISSLLRSATAGFASKSRPSFSSALIARSTRATHTRARSPVPKRRSSSVVNRKHSLSTALLAAGGGAATASSNAKNMSSAALCEPDDADENYSNDDDDMDTVTMPFSEEEGLHFDTYNGVTMYPEEVDSALTSDPSVFATALQNALTIWNAEGRKGIWIHVPTSMAHLIPVCIDAGFDFHVVKKNQHFSLQEEQNDSDTTHSSSLVLSQWLPDTPSRLPYGPTHQLGIGALVLHPSDPTKMLVVQEKTGPAAARKLWKMPTGLADPGEDVADAAVRELLEETGLNANFDSIVCFRQAHPSSDHRKTSNAASASDMFFICLLRLEEGGADLYQAQEEEIADIAWKTIEEYSSQDLWQGSPLYGEINRIMSRAADQYAHHQPLPDGFIETKLDVGFRPGTNSLYMMASRM